MHRHSKPTYDGACPARCRTPRTVRLSIITQWRNFPTGRIRSVCLHEDSLENDECFGRQFPAIACLPCHGRRRSTNFCLLIKKGGGNTLLHPRESRKVSTSYGHKATSWADWRNVQYADEAVKVPSATPCSATYRTTKERAKDNCCCLTSAKKSI